MTPPPPAMLPYRVLLTLWLAAEQLLETCAASKDRLIDFEKGNVPVDPAGDKQPAAKKSFWPFN